jgi:integrase
MPVKYLSQNVEPIEPGLAVVEKLWISGGEQLKKVYRARIYQTTSQSYHHKTLACDNFLDAKQLAIDYFQQFKTGNFNRDTRAPQQMSLRHCVAGFIEAQRIAVHDGRIQRRRFEVLQRHLETLERYSHAIGRPKLEEFVRRYHREFRAWQSTQLSAKTRRPLSVTSRDAELKSHRQFFRWLQLRGILADSGTVPEPAGPQPLCPFPSDCYDRLVATARQDIKMAGTERDRWNRAMWFAAAMVLHEVGCRVSELRRLKWIDLEPLDGDFCLHVTDQKRQRVCVLSDSATQHLLNWKNFQFNHGAIGEYVFTLWQQSVPFIRVSRHIKNRWFRAAGISDPEQWTFSCFQHSFLVNALSQADHLEQIAAYCGMSADVLRVRYALTVQNKPEKRQSAQPIRLPA